MKKTNTKKEESVFDKLAKARERQKHDAHWMEPVGGHNGALWINHSMATSVEVTWEALKSVEGPVLLILGGIDRGTEYEKLSGLIKEKVKAVIFMGSPREKYFKVFQSCTNGLICEAANLREAVQIARSYAYAGDTVLFAPCCPSYDVFDNYKNRGDLFRKFVQELDK